jgi:cyanophycin synthetase
VVGTAGDRRDEDILELGRTAARHFDLCVVKEDRNLRGRAPGEVAALVEAGVREGIAAGGRTKEVRVLPDELEAVRWAVGQAAPGDVLAICADRTDAVYAELEALGHAAMHE